MYVGCWEHTLHVSLLHSLDLCRAQFICFQNKNDQTIARKGLYSIMYVIISVVSSLSLLSSHCLQWKKKPKKHFARLAVHQMAQKYSERLAGEHNRACNSWKACYYLQGPGPKDLHTPDGKQVMMMLHKQKVCEKATVFHINKKKSPYVNV